MIGVLVLMMVPCGAFAQDAGTTWTFSEQQVDRMLASIALYPECFQLDSVRIQSVTVSQR
jgi:hypothetical protein